VGRSEVARHLELLGTHGFESLQCPDFRVQHDEAHRLYEVVERGETVVRVHLRAIVGLTLATVYRVDLVPTAVWKISAELVLALDEHLGPPVDSYVNGSQTWLVGDEPNDPDQSGDTAMILEFRLHPVSGYRPPAGCSHYDLWETVVTQLSQGADAQELRLGNE